eukprot:TRINITY_DN74038_c0_g1_i1.p1 TRINITY_DN74038_c0_g1~~TRINITY_DN74038_c0_g1_i1.p1  ORF type:complete len:224 (+),score=11.28 TRINITY_DN74038_c0_g1_i1:23-694(+)
MDIEEITTHHLSNNLSILDDVRVMVGPDIESQIGDYFDLIGSQLPKDSGKVQISEANFESFVSVHRFIDLEVIIPQEELGDLTKLNRRFSFWGGIQSGLNSVVLGPHLEITFHGMYDVLRPTSSNAAARLESLIDEQIIYRSYPNVQYDLGKTSDDRNAHYLSLSETRAVLLHECMFPMSLNSLTHLLSFYVSEALYSMFCDFRLAVSDLGDEGLRDDDIERY